MFFKQDLNPSWICSFPSEFVIEDWDWMGVDNAEKIIVKVMNINYQ